MTIIDVFIAFPVWAKIVSGIIIAVWGFEMLLLPFKFNMLYKRANEQLEVIRQILAATTVNQKDSENMRKLLTLLMDLMLPKKSKEDTKKSSVE